MIKIRRQDSEIPMASMSDIAFLLIIFFIVTISFVYKQGLQMVLPKKDSKPVVVNIKETLMLKLGADGALYRDSVKLSGPEGIKISVEKAAIIKVEKKCKYAHVVALVDHLQKNNVFKISIKPL